MSYMTCDIVYIISNFIFIYYIAMWIRRKKFEEQQNLLQTALTELKLNVKSYNVLEKKFEAQKETILTLNGRCEVWAEKYNALGQELVEAQKTIKSLQRKLTSTIEKNKELIALEKDLKSAVEKLKRMWVDCVHTKKDVKPQQLFKNKENAWTKQDLWIKSTPLEKAFGLELCGVCWQWKTKDQFKKKKDVCNTCFIWLNGWKVCSKCWKRKPLSEYWKATRSPDWYHWWCKSCINENSKKHK